MENPFQVLLDKLDNIEQQLAELQKTISKDSSEKRRDSDEMLGIDEVAEFLKLTKPTIYSKVSRKEIPYYKLYNRLYFNKEEVVKLIKHHKVRTHEEIQLEAHNYLKKTKGW